jgi:hypothetical protein
VIVHHLASKRAESCAPVWSPFSVWFGIGVASNAQLPELVKFGVPGAEWIGFADAKQLIRSKFSERRARYASKDFIMPFGKYRGHTFSSVPHDPI